MSDKKDKSGADLEENLAKIANAKPRRRNRKDNIYERFITRVESIEETEALESLQSDDFDTPAHNHTDEYSNNDTNIDTGIEIDLLENANQKSTLKPLKNADKLSSYEPLSAAELDLFAIQDQELLEENIGLQEANNNTTSVSLDFSDKEDEEAANLITTSYAVDIDESEVLTDKEQHLDIDEEDVNVGSLDAPSLLKKTKKKKAVKSSSKQASNKKPLIMGMVLGSLMIGGAVLALIATGVLSTEPNSANAPAVENVTTTSPANNSEASATEQNIVDANSSSTVAGEPNAGTTTAEPLTPNPQKTQATADELEVSAPKAEPAITYEDFREESQSTLYRETND